MSTKLTSSSFFPSSILTPSTIQCTKFYSDASVVFDKRYLTFSFASHDMRRYLNTTATDKNDHTTENNRHKTRSVSMPVISTTNKPAIRLINRSLTTFPCLLNDFAENIQRWLPSRISISNKWSLIYSLDQHGASLNTLYNNCQKTKPGPCLLVIQDSEYQLFGAYITENIHIESNCYGTGESFLWKQDKKTMQITAYPWTMANDYLVYSSQEFFAVGGGQGRFGLWLHSDLARGYSETCATFNNPVLSTKPSFDCIGLEIWNFEY